MVNATRLAALCALLVTTSAQAGSTLNVASLSVDGLEVRDLSCALDKAPLLGAIVVVAALASQKEALTACGPEGAAFATRFSWTDRTTATVTSASNGKGSCIEAAMAKIPADLSGSCSVVLLTGPTPAAEAARQKLSPPPSDTK